MTTAEKIKAARKRAGLTQKRLGELCGIAEPTIRKYELGKLNPKKETLEKIAEPLGVYYASLYGDNEGDEITSYIKAGIQMGVGIQISEQRQAFFAELHHLGYEFTEAEQQMVRLFNHLKEDTQELLIVDLVRLCLNPKHRKEELLNAESEDEDNATAPPPAPPEDE